MIDLQTAIRYAERGWHVFPLIPSAKEPFKGTTGFYDATLDIGQIEAWHFWRADANIGIRTGSVSGLVVVDLDTKHGPRGDEEWTRLVHEHGGPAWLDTAMVVTPNHGYHLYYALREGVTIRPSVSKLAPGVDIRGDGSYVVAPPSAIPNTDGYNWLAWPAEGALAPLPAWVVERLAAHEHDDRPAAPARRKVGDEDVAIMRILAEECDRIAAAPEGTRNTTAFAASAAIGNLVAGGELRVAIAADWLLEAAVASGLPRHEAETAVANGLEAGIATPRTLGGHR